MADRLIIAGSRDLNPTVAQISSLITDIPSLVICGCAHGVDRAGYMWARHFSVPVEFFPAWMHHKDWALSVRLPGEVIHSLPRISNRGAGFVRNENMNHFADRAILFWTGESSGTRNMRDICLRKGMPCKVHAFMAKDGYCVPA